MRRCTARTRAGNPCRLAPVRGALVCCKHGGAAPQVKARAAVRAEVMRWGLGDTLVSPEDTLLRLISQSSTRAQRLASALEEQVANHGDLAAAMVGDTMVTTADGATVKVGEYLRGLVQLESQERDRLANFCAKAIAAGLARRQVELAEKQGALIADVLRAVLGDPELKLTVEQRALVPAAIRRHLNLAG